MLPRFPLVVACTMLLVMLIGLICPVASAGDTPVATEPGKVRVICPALEVDESQRPINGPMETNLGPIKLVVLGTAKRREQNGSRKVEYELKVEKVLYGSTSEKTLRLCEDFYIPEPERRIFALVPEAYGKTADYEAKYSVDVKEEKAQMALSAARLDYHALAADSIFVGKETAVDANDDHKHTIEVVRLLHGSEPNAGEKSVMEVVDHIKCSGKVATIHREPMLVLPSHWERLSGQEGLSRRYTSADRLRG